MVRRSYPGCHPAALEAEFKRWIPIMDAIERVACRYRFSSLEAMRLRNVAAAMTDAIEANGFTLIGLRGVYEGPERIARAPGQR